MYQLDGFLTAIISSPNCINILHWSKIAHLHNHLELAIIMQFYNKIYNSLKQGNYTPSFTNLPNLNEEPINWAKGYLEGKNLWSEKILNLHKAKINNLLTTIIDLSLCSNLHVIKLKQFLQSLSTICINIYNFWLQECLIANKNYIK